MNRTRAALALTTVLLTGADPTQAQVVSAGHDPAATLKAAVRFRNFSSGSDREVYLGRSGLGSSERVEIDFLGRSCSGATVFGSWRSRTPVRFGAYLGFVIWNLGFEINLLGEGRTDSYRLTH